MYYDYRTYFTQIITELQSIYSQFDTIYLWLGALTFLSFLSIFLWRFRH